MRTILSLTAAGMLASAVALAQTPPADPAGTAAPPAANQTPPATTAPNTAVNITAATTPARKLTLRQEMKQNLQNAGFSNVIVVPDSYLVRARDQAGNPVTMFVSSDSVTEIVADTKQDGSAAAEDGTQESFVAVPATEPLSSNVVGLEVYNAANQDIGTIKDIAYGHAAVKAYILGVGGFLGVGDHYVAVKPSAMAISYDANGKKWQAKMDITADQLKTAPEYKYPNQS